MPNYVPPVPINSDFGESVWEGFFEQLRKLTNNPPVTSLSVNPTVDQVPDGTYSVWKNTTSGEVRIWSNDGGLLKSVLLA